MKQITKKYGKRLMALPLLIGVAASVAGCDALLSDASVEAGPGYYGAGVYHDWYPSLPGAPLISPVYWGNQAYPGPMLPPLYRPTPAWPAPPSGGSGNSRPASGGNGNAGISFEPATSETPGNRPAYTPPSGTVAVPDHYININGSNPGPAILPKTGNGGH